MTDLQRRIVEISNSYFNQDTFILQKQRADFFNVSQKKHLLQGYNLYVNYTNTKFIQIHLRQHLIINLGSDT